MEKHGDHQRLNLGEEGFSRACTMCEVVDQINLHSDPSEPVEVILRAPVCTRHLERKPKSLCDDARTHQ